MEILKDLILAEHSKAQALLIADLVAQKPELISDLIAYTFANEEPLSRRASWPLRLLFDHNPAILKEYLHLLINQLDKIQSKAVLRNIFALLANAEIPEYKKSFLLDFSANAILNPESPVAVIAHASSLFAKIAGNELILINELILMLEQVASQKSGGIQAKMCQIKRIGNKLEKNKTEK